MAIIGADVEQLEQLSNTLTRKADDVAAIAGELRGLVDGVTWIGTDAERFKSNWAAVTTALNAVQESLANNATVLKSNADQQRTTSAS
ncbi:MAG: WXG100 family type VII secretion target [Microthrixaceae bacterium]|nr:WXG100 family type VII secretion target [Microthrixaceae bacterium]MCO5313120.1 WXG100 family type VII secretion target [Microthrixaceae bacterium]